ncbi:MAG: hypothetical protein J0H00_14260 [Burkholderiales bacterium]|nr:hypothetical protein [Burkholderiales bacterium]OJX06969.1 MAG: hypothetical protein BGO72_09445 [Burkholderiales bacterium 70-64]
MHKLLRASLALALAAPFGALADTPSEIESLRREIATMRADYEARLQALEQRLRAAETPRAAEAAPATRTAEAAPAPVSAPTPASASASAPASAPAPTPAPAAAANPNAFNPALLLILSGTYTRTSQDPAKYAIAGLPLSAGAEVGPGSRGLSLAESEIGFAASIDPWLRGAAFVAVHPDDSVSVEEAWVQTTALGSGFSLKAGRFFSGIGYLNPKHAHTWDFVDNPLAYQALLGGQYGDDGLQLTWVAPTELLVELGAEIGRGRGFPGGGDTSRNGAGVRALSAHAGGDIGTSHSWRAGISMLEAKANGQELVATDAAGATTTDAFTGNTRVWIADAVWKWAPDGNATRTSFTLQGEYLRSARRGELVYDSGGADSAGTLRMVQSGWYLQGVYQFMPRWRLGLRTERLDPGAPDYGSDSASLAASLAASGYRPHRNTLMVDFSPSEFSRVRLQFARDRARAGIVDNQVFLQYQMSLGAHGAHGY